MCHVQFGCRQTGIQAKSVRIFNLRKVTWKDRFHHSMDDLPIDVY